MVQNIFINLFMDLCNLISGFTEVAGICHASSIYLQKGSNSVLLLKYIQSYVSLL